MNVQRYYSCFALSYNFLEFHQIIQLKPLCKYLQNLLNDAVVCNNLSLILTNLVWWIENIEGFSYCYKHLIFNNSMLDTNAFYRKPNYQRLLYNVTQLELYETYIDETYVDEKIDMNSIEIKEFPKMKCIKLSYSGGNDNNNSFPMDIFKKFPNLERIKLDYQNDSKDIEKYRNEWKISSNMQLDKITEYCPNLQEVIIKNSLIGSAGISRLARLKDLRILEIYRENIDEHEEKHEIDIGMNGALIMLTDNCINIEKLTLCNFSFTDSALSFIDNFKKLKALKLEIIQNYRDRIESKDSLSKVIESIRVKLPLLKELNIISTEKSK